MTTEQKLEQKLQAATEVLKQFDAAAVKFITKVDTGRARSVETYRDLKEAREALSALEGWS